MGIKKGMPKHPLFSKFNVQLLARQSAKTLVEFVDTATSAHLTLFTSVEWVTLVAYVQVQSVFT